jgi:mannosyltransferase
VKLQLQRKTSFITYSDQHLLYFSILLGAFLRFYRLGSQSIWGDEALTLQSYTVGSSLAQLLSSIWHKAFHPPLYFVIAHYWYQLGQSEIMLRFPSAVFGVAAIPMMYLITRRFFRVGAPGISALVVALSPFHVWYSQEARMYSPEVLLAMGSTLFFLRAWKTRRPADYALYGLLTLMGLYTHIGTLLLVAAQGVFVVGAAFRDRGRLIVWIGVMALVLLLYAPWMANFVLANKHVGGGDTIGFGRSASPLHLAYGLYTFGVGYSLGPSVSELHYLTPRVAVLRNLPVIGLCGVIFGTLAALGLVYAYRAHRFGFWFVLSGFAVPLSLIALASLMPGVSMNPRYLMVAIIPYWMILALGIEACSRIRGGIVIPLAACGLVAAALSNHYLQPAYAKQDMRSAVALINDKAEAGDVAIISSVEIGGPFIYYFKRGDVPYIGYPPGHGQVDPRRLPADMARILDGKTRAWLVLGRTWSSDPHGLILDYLRARHKIAAMRAYHGVSVTCFLLSRSSEVKASRRTVD